jgi:hypothetical protein
MGGVINMQEKITRILRFDIDAWPWLFSVAMIGVLVSGTHRAGIGAMAHSVAIVVSVCLFAFRPGFLARRCCVTPLPLMPGEKINLRIAATLQERYPLVGNAVLWFIASVFSVLMLVAGASLLMFRAALTATPVPIAAELLLGAALLTFAPVSKAGLRTTSGWLYLTAGRIIFHSRKRTIAVPFDSVRTLRSEPRIVAACAYTYARRIHIQTIDQTVTIGVRYPHLLRRELERQLALQR